MSEAWGSVLIKSSDLSLMDLLEASEEEVSWDLIKHMFKVAGIESLEGLHPLLLFSEGNDFPHEGLERNGEFIDMYSAMNGCMLCSQ